MTKITDIASFLARTKLNETTGCFEWTMSRKPSGYGNAYAFNKQWKAHRLAWVLANGPVPHGMQVLHKCDNPPCCNPAHLFTGTIRDNMDDRAAKGRTARGEHNGRSKFTASQVVEIIDRIKSGCGVRKLARELGVHHGSISDICKGKNWGHATALARPQ